MAVQIVPAICTAQQVYDYMGISAADAAADISNGTTTCAAYIAQLMSETATQLAQWCGYDYTSGQFQNIQMAGNNFSSIEFPFPIGTIDAATEWNPYNPTVAPVDISALVNVLSSWNKKILIRNDGGIFWKNFTYFFNFTQASDPTIYNGWPLSCVQVQLEMISTIYRESNNSNLISILGGTAMVNSYALGTAQSSAYLGFEKKYLELTERWKDRIRGSRRIAI